MGFTSLSKAVEGAKAGTESSLKPFAALGITQADLTKTGGNFSKQILLVADALGKAEGSSTRQAAASKILGRGYQTILPMFSKGAAGLQEQLRWADEFGATMGGDTVDAMSDFTNAQRRAEVAGMGLQIAFAKHATPAITAALDKFGEFVKIINSGELTRAQKLTRLRGEFQKLQQDVVKLVTDLAPQIAQGAGEIGVALAKGIGKAFMETGLLGKVALTAFVLRSFGGVAAIAAAGKVFGTIFGGAAATGAAGGLAGGAAGGAGAAGAAGAAAAAGGLLSKVKSFAKTGAAVTALFGGLEIANAAFNRSGGDVLSRLDEIDNRGKGVLGTMSRALGGGDGGPLEFLNQGGLSQQGDIAHDLKDTLNEIGTANRERYQVLKGQANSLAEQLDLTRKQRNEIQNIIGASRVGRQNQQAASIQSGMETISSGQLIGPDLRAVVDRQLQSISQTYNRYTPQWRSAVEGTLNAQIQATRDAYSKGGKLTREGIKRIQDIIARRQKLMASGDPVGIARGIANGWTKARSVNQVNIRGFIQRLNKMTPAARQTAGASMLAYARELDAKGKLPDGTLQKLRSKFIRRFGPDMWRKIQQGAASGLSGVDKTAKDTGNKFDEMASSAVKAHNRIKRSASSVPGPVRTAYQSLANSANTAADAFGSNQKVSLSFRRGGELSQPGSKRLVPAAVSPGELISYKSREMYVPGRPEPRDSVLMYLPIGAKVFTSDGQRRLASGASETEALRRQAPHFGGGGMVGNLPSPKLSGGARVPTATGQAAIDRGKSQAQKWIERLKPSLQGMEKLAAKFGLDTTSGYRAGDDGYHGVNRARDFSNSDGPTAEMFKFANYVGTNFGQHLLELIYTPLGWAIKNGARTAPYAEADHFDHVHVALRNGGKVTSKSPMKNRKQWGPNQLHTLASAVGMSNPGLMTQIAQAESGGNAKLNNAGLNSDGSVDYGLWQINSIHGKPVSGMLNPIQNALYAKEILNREGIGAWSAYNNGRYSGFSGGRFDKEFYWDLIYSDEAQDKAKGGARRKVRRANAVGKRFKENGGKPGTRGKVKAAIKAAKQSLRLARAGNVGGAGRAGRKATGLTKQAGAGIGQAAPDNAPANAPTRPSASSFKGLPGFKNLPESIKKLLTMPGLSMEDKVAIYERAATIAEGTAGSADDDAVRSGQLALQTGIRNNALKTARRTSNFLKNYSAEERARDRATVKNKNASKAARKAARARLNRLGSSPETRTNALTTAASAESEIATLKGGSEASVDLATAMKELAEAIKEQNQLQSSVQATSSREALRMLSDVISGQIVGKRTSVTQPLGVRY
jgi:hypothetical protein